jgi:hypothetical protein
MMDGGLAAAVSEVAKLGKIPSENQRAFCEKLTKQYRDLRRVGEEWRRPEPHDWLGPIAEQATALRDELRSESLRADQRIAIERQIVIAQRNCLPIAYGRNKLLDIAVDGACLRAFFEALDALAKYKRKPRLRGRPGEPSPLQPGARAVDAFVVVLQRLVWEHGGVPLTAAQDGSGTMFEALDKLGVSHTQRGVVDALWPRKREIRNIKRRKLRSQNSLKKSD